MAITHDYVSWSTGNDYKGATFTDGAFTVADMTLTKAGAFAASKANHWLYLTDNGSNNVTDGYYRIASVTSANAVVLATSPKSGATDPTDVKCTQHDGSTTLPWRSLQGAFDLCTRNTTDGNQVNLKAGTAHVNSAALDLTTFVAGGALSRTAPLILRGYTSTANDGGTGEIDCGGATMISATPDFLILVDLEIHSGGDNHLISLDDQNVIHHCEIHKGASLPTSKYLIAVDSGNIISNCYIHDHGAGPARCISLGTRGLAFGNYVLGENTDSNPTLIYTGSSCTVLSNIVVARGASTWGINSNGNLGETCFCIGNIVYNTASGTNNAIYVANPEVVALNNIIEGWSGVGGDGVGATNILMVGFNAFYNNTAENTISDQKFLDLTANDVALAADPFTDAANGDFSLTAAAKTALAAKGFPTSYFGAHANTVPNLNIGPIQMAAGGTGGGTVNLLHGKLG